MNAWLTGDGSMATNLSDGARLQTPSAAMPSVISSALRASAIRLVSHAVHVSNVRKTTKFNADALFIRSLNVGTLTLRRSHNDAKKRLPEEIKNMSFENDRFVKSMDFSDYCFEVVRLASLNKTPKEIEEILGLEHYSIHKKFHAYLMMGYRKYFETHEWNANLTEERRALIRRVFGRLYKVIGKKNGQVFAS